MYNLWSTASGSLLALCPLLCIEKSRDVSLRVRIGGCCHPRIYHFPPIHHNHLKWSAVKSSLMHRGVVCLLSFLSRLPFVSTLRKPDFSSNFSTISWVMFRLRCPSKTGKQLFDPSQSIKARRRQDESVESFDCPPHHSFCAELTSKAPSLMKVPLWLPALLSAVRARA